MDAQQIRQRLIEAGDRREAARAEVTQASAEIKEWTPRALEAGLTKMEISELAKISRAGLDKLLKR